MNILLIENVPLTGALFHFWAAKIYNLLSCQQVCDALNYHLGNRFISFASKLYRQTVSVQIGTTCDPHIVY